MPPLSVLFIAPEVGSSEGASYLILRTMRREGGRNVGGVRSDAGRAGVVAGGGRSPPGGPLP